MFYLSYMFRKKNHTTKSKTFPFKNLFIVFSLKLKGPMMRESRTLLLKSFSRNPQEFEKLKKFSSASDYSDYFFILFTLI